MDHIKLLKDISAELIRQENGHHEVNNIVEVYVLQHRSRYLLLNRRNGPTLLIGLRSALMDNETIKQNIIQQGGQNNEKHR